VIKDQRYESDFDRLLDATQEGSDE
jgi:hypothetical protein